MAPRRSARRSPRAPSFSPITPRPVLAPQPSGVAIDRGRASWPAPKLHRPHPVRSSVAKENLRTIGLLNEKIALLEDENGKLKESWALNLETDGDWLAGLRSEAMGGPFTHPTAPHPHDADRYTGYFTDEEIENESEWRRELFVNIGELYRESSEFLSSRKMKETLGRVHADHEAAIAAMQDRLDEATDANRKLHFDNNYELALLQGQIDEKQTEIDRINEVNKHNLKTEREQNEISTRRLQAGYDEHHEKSNRFEKEVLQQQAAVVQLILQHEKAMAQMKPKANTKLGKWLEEITKWWEGQ